MTSLWALAAVVLFSAACADTGGTPAHTVTTPSVLVPDANYAGEWAGGWRTTSCIDLPPQPGYCASNVRRDFEPVRLNLMQSGERVSGTIQTIAGGGNVAGVIDHLGRLRVSGLVMSIAARGVPSRPLTRIVDWRTTSTRDGYMVGGVVLEHLRGSLQTPAANAIGEFTDTLLKKCPGPKFIGLFWEC